MSAGLGSTGGDALGKDPGRAWLAPALPRDAGRYIRWIGTLPEGEAMAHLTGLEGVGKESAAAFLKKYEETATAIERHPTSMLLKNRVLHAVVGQEEGEFRKRLLSRAALADEPVTTDTKRLIRMPTSLHGGSGMRVQPLSSANSTTSTPSRTPWCSV